MSPSMPSKLSVKRGFTLVELLVVIAIIGILIALLLPAVQAARESARQTHCKNNLKQVGLGLELYEGSFKIYPVGSAVSPGTGFGLSWWTGVLTYMEQDAITEAFDQLSANCGHPLLNPQNGALGNGRIISPLWCPSSSLPQLSTNQHMLASYVGIAGSTNEDGLTGSPVSQCCTPTANGEVSGGGVLIPNQGIRKNDILDGTSHVIAVGECSNYSYESGLARNITGAFPISWMTGTGGIGTPPTFDPTMRRQCYNITTIKHAPNTENYLLAGVRENHGPNNPLTSAHPGGVFVVKVDGSVHFIRDTISMIVLRRLATRKDGAPTDHP